MKRLLVGGAAVALLSMAACATDRADEPMTIDEASEMAPADASNAQTQVHHQVVNGGGASAFGGDGLTFYHVNVWQMSNDTAFLDYFVQSVDPTSEVCITEPLPPFPPCPPEDPACPCNLDPALPECQGEPGEYTYCYYTRFTHDFGFGEIDAADFQSSPNVARLLTTIGSDPGFYSEHCVVDEGSWFYNCTPGTGGVIDLTWSSNGLFSSFSNGVNKHKWGKYLHITAGQQRHSSADVTGSLLGIAVDGDGDMQQNKAVQVDIMPTDPFGPLP